MVRRYSGLGEERPCTRRKLAREVGMPTARVEGLVNAALSDLIGMGFDRVCAACGASERRTRTLRTVPADRSNILGPAIFKIRCTCPEA